VLCLWSYRRTCTSGDSSCATQAHTPAVLCCRSCSSTWLVRSKSMPLRERQSEWSAENHTVRAKHTHTHTHTHTTSMLAPGRDRARESAAIRARAKHTYTLQRTCFCS
jgi:hypothetical protein